MSGARRASGAPGSHGGSVDLPHAKYGSPESPKGGGEDDSEAGQESSGLYGSDVGTSLLRSGAAELVGAFILVFTGTAVAVGAALGLSIAGAPYDSLAVALAFGIGLAVTVSALSHISGAHFNPAVTLGQAAAGKFPWRSVPAYLFAQLAGAMLGALATWIAYGALARDKANLGATFPADGVGAGQALVVEALVTFVLVFVVVAVATDERVEGAIASFAVGLALAAGVFIAGPVTGGAVNPARALGPMLVAGDLSSFWLYILGPIIGGVAATFLYDFVSGERGG